VEGKARLMVKAVFWSVILYDQSKLVTMEEGATAWYGIPCPTAMTDGYNIVLNLDFFSKLSVEERVFVLAHEIYHVMSMHPRRMRRYAVEGLFGLPFLPHLYNIMCDVLINRHLIESAIGKAPNGCVKLEVIGKYKITGLELPEELYEKWLDDNPGVRQALERAKKTAEAVDADILEGLGSAVLSGDVVLNSPDAAGVATVNEASMKAAIQAALTHAAGQGSMPAGMKRYIDEFLAPKIKWEDKLRTSIITNGRSASWNKPNRRRIVSPGCYIPRRVGLRSGDVVLAVDTSGSTISMMKQFLGETASILGDARPNSLTLIWCDAAVDGVEELTEPDELRAAIAARGIGGGGGTSFVPPFEYIRDHDIPCDTLIYLTDGFGPFPTEDMADGFETIWAICNRQVTPPFGTHLVIE
jgi:predicted metal-dependent peptidase